MSDFKISVNRLENILTIEIGLTNCIFYDRISELRKKRVMTPGSEVEFY